MEYNWRIEYEDSAGKHVAFAITKEKANEIARLLRKQETVRRAKVLRNFQNSHTYNEPDPLSISKRKVWVVYFVRRVEGETKTSIELYEDFRDAEEEAQKLKDLCRSGRVFLFDKEIN